MQESVKYLEHRIDAKRVHNTRNKVGTIAKALMLKNVKQLWLF